MQKKRGTSVRKIILRKDIVRARSARNREEGGGAFFFFCFFRKKKANTENFGR